MNIQNISALAEQLHLLGFENAGYSLLKRICFKPENFVFIQHIKKGNEELCFQLFYEKNNKQDTYFLMYYDAILQQEITLNSTNINGVEVPHLEKNMIVIDWKRAFDFAENKRWSADDKTSWENEQKIGTIMNDLAILETTDEGKAVAASLKLKYWNGSAYYELFDNIAHPKGKAEISQRFYFSEGQAGISVDEAYRFLQNRRLEKQMQAKKKQIGKQEVDEGDDAGENSSGTGLLKKKRLSGRTGKKNNKSVSK